MQQLKDFYLKLPLWADSRTKTFNKDIKLTLFAKNPDYHIERKDYQIPMQPRK